MESFCFTLTNQKLSIFCSISTILWHYTGITPKKLFTFLHVLILTAVFCKCASDLTKYNHSIVGFNLEKS